MGSRARVTQNRRRERDRERACVCTEKREWCSFPAGEVYSTRLTAYRALISGPPSSPMHAPCPAVPMAHRCVVMSTWLPYTRLHTKSLVGTMSADSSWFWVAPPLVRRPQPNRPAHNNTNNRSE